MKKSVAVLLLTAIALGLCAAGAGAAAPTFPDISDAAVAENVAVLQMLGVINGDGGMFRPDSALTRAEFCKMSVIVMGREKEEPLYRNRTIFPDVRSSHWARGYINLAVTGDGKVISGFTDGTFRPDADITLAQAATLLTRVLGYTDADAGMLWPSGYMDLAGRVGLTDGVELASGAAISRAQAAKLFRNLLTADTKEGAAFITTLGTVSENVIIMDLDAQTPGGKQGGIKTSMGVLLPKGGDVPGVFLGKRGALVTDSLDRVLTFMPAAGESLSVGADSAGATWIKDSAGKRYDIPASATVYTRDGETTFDKIFVDISPGTVVTVFYSPGGAVDAVYLNTEPADSALVVMSADVTYRTFTPITGGGQVKIYKNGVEAELGDIAKYDVATFDYASRALRVSNFRITGYYEDAWPNTQSPSRVTVMGREFGVLPGAAVTLSEFRVGQTLTLLFTSDDTVAGAVKAHEAGNTAIGIVDGGITGSEASVTLLNGMKFRGDPGLSDYSASQLAGELVNVTSSGTGRITLSRVAARQGITGAVDIKARKLGDYDISRAARILERVGRGAVSRVSLDDMAVDKVPAGKIAYAALDGNGRVDILIFNDVTGDRYTYGFLTERLVEAPYLEAPPSGTPASYNRYVTVTGPDGTSELALAAGIEFRSGALGGVVFAPSQAGGGEMTAEAAAALTEHRNVRRSDFAVRDGRMTVTLGGAIVPVWDGALCYNSASKRWFGSLADARAFSDDLTVYYDRTPETGGKIRVVIAN
ncbi:MAG: S-layer homology domain-containing protein [Oscillospiraceae bacterium]|nr:S-layer homology domain-containing protein [Oscillospiraceae bacterium]